MFKYLPAAIFLIGLSGCGPAEETQHGVAETDVAATAAETGTDGPSSGVYIDNMDQSTRPQDDFFRYVNGAWLDKAEIPADRVRWGSSYEIIERNENRMRVILDETAAADAEPGSDTQKIRDYFNAYMDEERANLRGVSALAEAFARIDTIENHDDVLAQFGWSIQRGVGDPFDFYVDRDREDTSRSLFYLWQGGLGLPDRDYYLKDDEKFGQIRTDYTAYIERILELSNIEAPAAAAQRIMEFETKLAEAHWPKEKTRDRLATYNLKSRDDLQSMTPDFNWPVYLDAAGLGAAEELVITTPSFFEDFAALFPTMSVEQWKQYLKYKLASFYAYQLGQEFFDAYFEFYGKTLRGQEEPRERWQYALSQINNLLADAMGRIYLKKYFPEEAKQRTEAMVENLRAAFGESIDALEWMSPETKAEAHRKLAALRVYVGYPGYWRDYTHLEIRPDDMLGNTMRGEVQKYRTDLDKLVSGPIDGEFGLPTQSFNAYYRPTAGELVFLAGFLQPPMFDLHADDAVNYGAIGRVIGHEVSHAFDDQGRKVDENGENRDWWAPQDAAQYEALAQVIVEQYEQFEPIEGIHINGKLTLGENIADLAGTIVAYRAYLKSLNGEEAPVIDGFTGPQRFFIGAAQINRSKAREGYLREQLLSDPHSPAPYRTTGVMPNIPEFYEVWDVQEGDAMYKAPEDRVVIW
jgi:endothelin-converting enzyme/putative endopeptidase